MKTIVRRFLHALLLLALLALLPALAQPARAGGTAGGLAAASDGNGTVHLFWFPPTGRMPPGGWRIDLAGGGKVATILPLADRRKDVATLVALPSGTTATVQSYAALALKVASDRDAAQAFGLATTLTRIAPGPKHFRATGLTASGAPSGVQLESAAVDSGVATVLPGAPRSLRAHAEMRGIVLQWSPAPQTSAAPALAYIIERAAQNALQAVALSVHPIVVIADRGTAQHLDPAAPTEIPLTYRIFSVDVFGRRSAPATLTFSAPDLRALAPPRVNAKAAAGAVTLTWQPRPDPHAAGYAIARATLFDGPYAPLVRTVFGPRTATYTDSTVQGGTTYYYRVIVVGPHGDLGPPSLPVAAQAPNPARPSRISALRADSGQSRVRLTWQPAGGRIAGYLVQRRAENETQWIGLTARPNPIPRYDDFFGHGKQGRLAYRVVTIGFDSQLSAPSDEVDVVLADTSAPSAPSVRSASGRNGKVTLAFVPAAPASKSAQFLVLRGGSARDEGIVLGDPLPASARTYQDAYVAAGRTYWYRLVALDAAGARSQPSDAVAVHVASAPVSAAADPHAQFVPRPFPHVVLDFAAPAQDADVMVQRRLSVNRPWTLVAGPLAGTQTVDPSPPRHATISYRIYYRAGNGTAGKPSAGIDVRIP